MIVLLVFLLFVAIPISFVFICIAPEQHVSILNTTKDKKPSGFWRRQFQFESTKNQRIFDWIFGVILPVICFSFDFFIFKGDETSGSGAMLGWMKPFAYLLSFTSVMAMMAWLIWGSKLKWLNGLLAGLFAVGGLISLGVGVVLFPFSVIGLIVLIGALGFTPLLTSIVFLRNSLRVYRQANPFFNGQTLIYTSILSALFAFVIPFAVNMEIKRLFDGMRTGDSATIQRNARILKLAAPITNFNSLINIYYERDKSPAERQAIAEVFEELTGRNIENTWSAFD